MSTKAMLLESYRVLDLTDEKGLLCGKILADLGADVIKIEKPGGDACRRFGPFYHDIPHPEKSLFWFAFNLNKRGITLNLEAEDGRILFRRLVEKADVVVESFHPGYMDQLDLGYASLRKINPGIIMTSITPFGQVGPRKSWKSSDIISMAMGGFMTLVGDKDLPPVRISVDQACFHGCAEGAVATLIALHERRSTGEGQYVDVSIQASIVTTTIGAVPHWELQSNFLQRSGPFRAGLRKDGKQIRQQWPCKDGFVSYAIWGGLAGAESNRALVSWMDSEGFANDVLKNIDWRRYDVATVDDAMLRRIEEPIANFFLAHAKEELYKGAIQRRIQLYPVYTIAEVVNSPQLAARDFWSKVEHDELGTEIIYPGAFAKSSEIPLNAHRRAPIIGEHNSEIYMGELGISSCDLNMLRQAGIL